MHNCIFNAHCTELMCDNSCPTLVETSYLLERNGISMKSTVFNQSEAVLNCAAAILQESMGNIKSVLTNKDTVKVAEILTYCAICQNWQGSRLHCNVYNLRYSKYLEEMKKSWSMKGELESLEYMRIWSESAKVLIISHLDFISFSDFESQTLLNLLQARQNTSQTTIIVSPDTRNLVGKSSKTHLGNVFFSRLKALLQDNRVKVEFPDKWGEHK